MTRWPRRLQVALVMCLGVGAACESAPTPSPFTEADSLVAAWVNEERIPGAVLRVEQRGELVFERAYGAAELYSYGDGQYEEPGGLARLDDPRPMTPATVFDLASVTNVMAPTLAIMVLVDRGDVDLDAPVSNYLADFVGEGRDDITPRHLLTHTSGMPQWVPTYYHASNPDQAYAYVRTLPLEWPVGEGRHYSDLGFMLLGRIVEAVDGRPLDDFVASAVHGPLGLTDTGFRPTTRRGTATSAAGASGTAFAATSHGNPFERRMVHDPSFGYTIVGDPTSWDAWRERTLLGEVNDGNAYHAFGGVAGHAGLFSTARELSVLLSLILNEGEHGGQRYLSPETVRGFLEPALDGQALGWQLPAYAPRGSVGHTGFTGTFVLGVPGQALSIVLLTNRQNAGVDAETQYPDIAPLQRAVTRSIAGASQN